ncbi:MAG: DUF2177 family protein [Deltaproteobacteria bacterium]|nr:DUF2177 family protein [Deltaproteobacteria bacterium]MBM4317973.1 DUF2177 family protein [Deltaproteobacteria bacterium]
MFFKLYFVTLPVFFAVDMLWLGLIARNFYRTHLGFLLKDSFDWKAAILFYLIFIFGLVFFVIAPSFQNRSWLEAITKGALFGLITYATYDLTNQATVKDWPILVTIADLTWGTFLAGSVSLISFGIADKLFR